MPGFFMPAQDATAAMLHAYEKGRPNTVVVDQWLLMGANINVCADSGKSILMLSAERGDVDNVRFLLSRKVAVNYINPDTAQSALTLACRADRAEIVSLLLQAGATVRHIDNSSLTPPAIRTLLKNVMAPYEHAEIEARQARLRQAAKARRFKL